MTDLTCEEAAEALGIPRAQLRRWAAQRAVGFEAGPKYAGRNWFEPEYREIDLEAWLEPSQRKPK